MSVLIKGITLDELGQMPMYEMVNKMPVWFEQGQIVEVDECRTYGVNTEHSSVYVERTATDLFDTGNKSTNRKKILVKLKNRLRTDLHEHGIGGVIFNWILVVLFFALMAGLALLVILILIHWIRFGFVPIIHLS